LIPDRDKLFLFSTDFRSALGPTLPPTLQLREAFSSKIKLQGLEDDQSLSTSAEVKDDGNLPPLPHTFQR
jgi:hypothetical protein